MCKTYGVTPDSSFIEDMDEYTWVWMYQSWIQDQHETHKIYKDYAVFLGSFFNAQMAQSIQAQEDPTFEASDEDFEKSTEVVRNLDKIERQKIKHRRRRLTS